MHRRATVLPTASAAIVVTVLVIGIGVLLTGSRADTIAADSASSMPAAPTVSASPVALPPTPTAAPTKHRGADVSRSETRPRPRPTPKRAPRKTAKKAPKPETAASSNPLAGGPWGVYQGAYDDLWPAYESSGGSDHDELAKIALQPRVRWYHSSMSISDLGDKIRDEIAQETDGDSDTLFQMAFFRLWPHGEGARNHPLSGGEQDDYRRAVDVAADAIGDTRTAIILEPDLALTAPPMQSGAESTADPGTRQSLVAYAAKRFSQLPRTSVYLDAGDADWLSLDKAETLLRDSGVEYARGFALGATHYSSVAMNVDYGADLVNRLEADGLGTKHFVIDTADNGRAFTYPEYYDRHPGGDFDNAETCGSSSDSHCDTLGPAPTWHTDEDGIGLSDEEKSLAAAYADGYLWFGRPWLVDQAAPFSLSRALQVARSTPYDQANVTGG